MELLDKVFADKILPWKEELAVGVRCKLLGGANARRWWWVQATSDRFTVLTSPAAFKPSGTLVYTVIDWERGIRGPVNTLGQGWEPLTSEGCKELVDLMEAGKLRVTSRNWCRVEFGEVGW